MRLDKLTQKAQEAIFEAQSLAESYYHAQVEPEHLLLALLQQADGVAPQIVLGLGRNPQQLAGQVEAELNRRPKVYGGAAQVGGSQALQRALQAAQGEAEAMKDDYVSTEHLLLALAGKGGEGAHKLLAAGASPGTPSCTRCKGSAAASASPARTRRPPTRRCKNMAAT